MDKLSDIQDYLELLCVKHKDLLHSADRKVFCRFQADEEVTNLSLSQYENIVVVSDINGQRIGSPDDQDILRGVGIMFASKKKISGGYAAAIDLAINKAEEIMLDFIVRMKLDQQNECGLNFDLDKVSWDSIDAPWLDMYYGWILFLPFKGYLPQYDADKWNS